MTSESRPTSRKTAPTKNGNGANLGFEATLWQAADKMRNNLDAAEYKHVVLGLIFLKYISDTFAERRQHLLAEVDQGADPEDPDEYRAENVFWVPQETRWSHLQQNARQPTIGKLIDRVHRDLTDAEIAQIADTYHAWRGDAGAGAYADIPGFCKSATLKNYS